MYPNRPRAFAALAIVGLGYIAVTTMALHFLPTGYNPITQAVSDYAVGSFSVLMTLGFLIGGVGNMSLAVALSRLGRPSRLWRIGALLVFLAGVGMFVVGLFPTDLEGSPVTTHGLIHDIVSQIIFITWPLGMVFVSYVLGRKPLSISILALVVAGTIFGLNSALALNAGGLSERIFISVLLSWSLLMSVRIYRIPLQ